MSAYSNLVGLYPTSKEKLDSILSELGEEDKWPETMPWQPIPVHTVPQTTDYVCYRRWNLGTVILMFLLL